MNRLVCLLLLTLVLSVVSFGCEEKIEKIYDDPYLDSLAAIRHDIRSGDNPFVTLETNFGKMTFELFRDVAPNHADSFLARTEDGFYDSTIFHRVVDNFMIQGGNPIPVGKKMVEYQLDAEFNDLPHMDGTLSMARARSENSAGTQFFVCLGRNRSTEWLDGKYTNFGHLIRGYDVLHRIAKVPVVASEMMGGEVSWPTQQVALIDAFVSDEDGNQLK